MLESWNAVAAVLATVAVAPPPIITSGPPSETRKTTAAFRFSGPSGLRCRLDRRPSERCRRSARYRSLDEGRHVFSLSAGRRRATYAWSIDLTRPARPVLRDSPAELSGSAMARFVFTGEATRCRLDAGAWHSCAGTHEYLKLADGAHRFAVVAHDRAGNASVATTYGWTVDTAAPPPPAILAPFAVVGSEQLLCELDSAPVACDGGRELTDGEHNFTAVAVDAAGNRSAPATYRWTVDTTPPPAPSLTRTGTTFEFAGAGDAFLCRLDDGPVLPCSSPQTLTGLAPGAHTFSVQARDGADNRSAPVTVAWTGVRYRDAVLATPGLLGYWRLGEAEWAPVRDELGAWPGLYSGGVTLGAAGAVMDDTAAAFDGVSGEVLLPGPVLSVNATLEGWFHWRAGVTVLRDHTGGGGWLLALDASGTGASNVTARAAGRTVTTSVPVTRLRDGWHLVTLTKAGATLAFYLDGAFAAGIGGAANTASVAPWHVMNNGTIAEQYAQGRADEIAVYDRALTADEVAAHFRVGHG
jgi:hypothetical protein